MRRSALAFVAFFAAAVISLADAKRRHRGHLPIDVDPDNVNGGGGSVISGGGDGGNGDADHARNKKASECRFGDRRYSLEDTWNPDLGPPFGVMQCVHCECVPIHKKRRIVGRVRCKNIKSECPAPTCDDPVLLPGRCCKVCPGQMDNPDLKIEVDLAREEEEKNGRHYAALMTPPPASAEALAASVSSAGAAATGRFYFRKKTLSYSIVANERFGFPKLLTFLDQERNIIEEFPLQTTPFQNVTGKVCGAWNRVPRRYRRQLRKDQLVVQITSAEGKVVDGGVAKHYGLTTEMFSGLLLPERSEDVHQIANNAAAVTPIVSVSSATGSIHTMLLIGDDVFGESDGMADINIKVAFESVKNERGNFIADANNDDDAHQERRIIEEQLIVPKRGEAQGNGGGMQRLTSVNFKTVFDREEMAALGNGRLRMTVSSANSPERAVVGFLAPRFSCDLFDTVLAADDDDDESDDDNDDVGSADDDGDVAADDDSLDVEQDEGDQADTDSDQGENASGMAWMFMKKDGEIEYHVRLDSIPPSQQIKSIHVDNGRKSRRLLKIVADLTPDPVAAASVMSEISGTIRLSAGDIEDLYKADLYINVATNADERLLRGRIMPQLMTEAHELARPVLMKASPARNEDGSTVAGIAWANIDSACTLKYQLRMSGITDSESSPELYRLLLKDYPISSDLKNLDMMPGRSTELQTFKSAAVEGHADRIHKLTMARLDAGDASLVVEGGASGEGETQLSEGRVIGVRAPPDCLPRYARNELELMPGYLSDLGEVRPEIEKELKTRCLYEGTIYEDGSQWSATHQKCQMCSCKRGGVVCDDILCPAPRAGCSQPIILEGECCATCQDDILVDTDSASGEGGCYFDKGDHKKYHKAGTKWHPYIPPFGFSRCATCACDANSLEVVCASKQCPPLDCPREQRVRPDKLACCMVCKEVEVLASDNSSLAFNSDPSRPHDMASEKTEQEVLDEGGCDWRGKVYGNGATWRPRVLPYGEMKCVECKCKDSTYKCKKHPCPKLQCKYRVHDKDSCCPRCAANRAEVQKSKRLNRLRKIKRLRRKKKQLESQRQNH